MTRDCERCKKRLFGSACAARQAHSTAGYRVRVYRCPDDAGYHVTASEKAGAHPPLRHDHVHRPTRGTRPGLAPVRTLAEVEALAAQKRHHFASADGATRAVLSLGPEGMKLEVLQVDGVPRG